MDQLTLWPALGLPEIPELSPVELERLELIGWQQYENQQEVW